MLQTYVGAGIYFTPWHVIFSIQFARVARPEHRERCCVARNGGEKRVAFVIPNESRNRHHCPAVRSRKKMVSRKAEGDVLILHHMRHGSLTFVRGDDA